MIWGVRVLLFLIGFSMGVAAPAAQADEGRFNRFEFYRMQTEAAQVALAREFQDNQQRKLEAELKQDQEIAIFSTEMSNLWSRLATLQNEYFTAKWNEQNINYSKAMEIKLIKEELARREKKVREHLKP